MDPLPEVIIKEEEEDVVDYSQELVSPRRKRRNVCRLVLDGPQKRKTRREKSVVAPTNLFPTPSVSPSQMSSEAEEEDRNLQISNIESPTLSITEGQGSGHRGKFRRADIPKFQKETAECEVQVLLNSSQNDDWVFILWKGWDPSTGEFQNMAEIGSGTRDALFHLYQRNVVYDAIEKDLKKKGIWANYQREGVNLKKRLPPSTSFFWTLLDLEDEHMQIHAQKNAGLLFYATWLKERFRSNQRMLKSLSFEYLNENVLSAQMAKNAPQLISDFGQKNNPSVNAKVLSFHPDGTLILPEIFPRLTCVTYQCDHIGGCHQKCGSRFIDVAKCANPKYAFDILTAKSVIDASESGNISRFINHACEPNMISVEINKRGKFPRLGFFAWKDIQIGEELSICYWPHLIGKAVERDPTGVKCLCSSQRCWKFLPAHKSSPRRPIRGFFDDGSPWAGPARKAVTLLAKESFFHSLSTLCGSGHPRATFSICGSPEGVPSAALFL
ncbi:unnamed protein product [Caenorhabditis auriculariae]|uniref:SET domain-containing protein n=1 Tax=Caenorhabditis auriculariae TaxID=2777116 RepID=A0A8S1GT70_9PELO|nr:unnamed protein product [Caenorhabditis auriculariae]